VAHSIPNADCHHVYVCLSITSLCTAYFFTRLWSSDARCIHWL